MKILMTAAALIGGAVVIIGVVGAVFGVLVLNELGRFIDDVKGSD